MSAGHNNGAYSVCNDKERYSWNAHTSAALVEPGEVGHMNELREMRIYYIALRFCANNWH